MLLHIAREIFPDIKAVFVDTGLEYPEIRSFVKTFDNVDWLRPKMGFKKVCEKYGFPLISKEVSERVYYAKRYLTWYMENRNSVTDRQTDRQTVRLWSFRPDGVKISQCIQRECKTKETSGEYP